MSHEFDLVDVFARRRYAGNQLAVVHDAADLDGDEMQAIAREFGFSETTFVESADPAGAAVRIFTPGGEIPFAGHPTLGTAAVLRERADGDPDAVTLSLGVGDVPVDVVDASDAPGDRDGDERFWMTQRAPSFGPTLDHDRLAEVLSIDPGDLDDDWPVRVVSTGLPTIVVPLRDRDALTRCAIDRAAYDTVTGDAAVADGAAENVLPFCPDPRNADNDLAVRMFAPAHGVPEDPATGSSNGCLAAYLARHRYWGEPTIEARVEQGYELGRPSLLHLRASDAGAAGDPGDAVSVEVGGAVVPVASGRLD